MPWHFQILPIFLLCVLESIWNVALFRNTWTWLPFQRTFGDYSWGYERIYCHSKIDPFHLFKGAQSMVAVYFLLFFMNFRDIVSWIIVLHYRFNTSPDIGYRIFVFTVIGLAVLLALFLIWFLYYSVCFNLLYHVVWMRKVYRDLKRSWPWRYILR